jgi:hypothetical protein
LEGIWVGTELKIHARGLWRAAALMHQARGKRAAEEAASRAMVRRLAGDKAGFNVWFRISAAIRALEYRRKSSD